MPFALCGIRSGGAAADPAFVAPLVCRSRPREPRSRRPVSAATRRPAGIRDTRLAICDGELLDLFEHDLPTIRYIRESPRER